MLKDKVVLITGGTGGIGSEIARQMANNNAKVCILYHANDKAAKELENEFKGKNKMLSYKANLCSEEEIGKAISSIIRQHSKIDVVVHSATQQTVNKQLAKTEWNDFQQHIDVQLKGFYNVVKAMMPSIIARSKEGKESEDNKNITAKFIVILTEYCTGKPPAGLSDYVSAKYALMGFAKSMSVELARYNCTVNMISPGMVNTKLLTNLPPKLIEMQAEANPMKRIAEPKDVAAIALFLASNASDYLNGANILVNGGNVMI